VLWCPRSLRGFSVTTALSLLMGTAWSDWWLCSVYKGTDVVLFTARSRYFFSVRLPWNQNKCEQKTENTNQSGFIFVSLHEYWLLCFDSL
jgi:hypothetical protein